MAMMEKYRLNLLVAFIILLTIIALIVARVVSDWAGLSLLYAVSAVAFTSLQIREKRPVRLSKFFVKSLEVSYIVAVIIWFVWVFATFPSFSFVVYNYLNPVSLVSALILFVFPTSLLPVAISVIIYGIFRTRLRVWEIFLSSWYVLIFVAYAGGISDLLWRVFLALLVAGILSVVYVVRKRRKINESKPMQVLY